MLEREVLKACLEFLQWKGVFCWRQNQGIIPTADGHFRRFVGLRGVSDSPKAKIELFDVAPAFIPKDYMEYEKNTITGLPTSVAKGNTDNGSMVIVHLLPF